VELSDLVHLWPVLVASGLLATTRVVKYLVDYEKRVLDYELERRVVEKEGSLGPLNVAELERARQHKRRRLRLRESKKEVNGSDQRSLPP
jgi:hypothetical protein